MKYITNICIRNQKVFNMNKITFCATNFNITERFNIKYNNQI